MLKCLLLRRKFYDYLDNNLSELNKIKLKRHLEVCNNCSQKLSQLKSILDLAAKKEPPKPNQEFWHNFKIDLDRKLNQRLIPPLVFERRLTYRLRPVLTYALALVLILVIGSYFYKNYSSFISLAQEDEALVDDIFLLDEIGEAPNLNRDEDAYINEINLFFQLDQDLT